MKYVDYIASALLIVGGLNWGLVGFFDFNLVTFLSSNPYFVKTVYGAFFVSAFWQAYSWYRYYNCSTCCK